MSILYLLTSPEPVISGTDAAFQEVQALQSACNGKRINLFPLQKPNSLVPKTVYGWHRIKALREQESHFKINHIFAPTLHYFPVFHCLKNPIVYTVVASVQGQRKPVNINRLKGLHRIVVSNERDRQVLKNWEIHNYSVIHPGVDISEICPFPLPLKKELTLLMASAPWEKAQFNSKGIDLLLEAAANLPFLKLIFLWRGLLFEEIQKKIKYYGVAQKVELINQKVNVNEVLKRVHATILLAKHTYLVKAFPHSLIESLVAGKPVIVSTTIPMADYVEKNGCGIVVDGLQMASLIESIESLMSQYQNLTDHARSCSGKDFSLGRMLEQYRELYRL